MTDKREKPLFVDMDFGEALRRFANTEKKEVDESIGRAKEKKPPGPDAPTTKSRQKATPSSRNAKRKADD